MRAGIQMVPPGAEIRGVPVVYRESSPELAHAAGVWPLKHIVVGPRWLALTAEEQSAVLLHEVWHCQRAHMEVRWLLFPFCWAQWAQTLARQQELDADAYAAREGYANELILFLARHGLGYHAAPFHPTPRERIQHIMEVT